MTEAILEIAKMLLSAYFSFARLNGASEEELSELYQKEKEKFDINSPDKLEDVN
jgi:hypothetical protein